MPQAEGEPQLPAVCPAALPWQGLCGWVAARTHVLLSCRVVSQCQLHTH